MFKDLVTELRECGMTFPQIAKKCGCSTGGIEAIYHGRAKEPRWSTGDKLIRLHKRMMALEKEMS